MTSEIIKEMITVAVTTIKETPVTFALVFGFMTVLFVLSKILEKCCGETWQEMQCVLFHDIGEIMPLIIGVSAGILASFVL